MNSSPAGPGEEPKFRRTPPRTFPGDPNEKSKNLGYGKSRRFMASRIRPEKTRNHRSEILMRLPYDRQIACAKNVKSLDID